MSRYKHAYASALRLFVFTAFLYSTRGFKIPSCCDVEYADIPNFQFLFMLRTRTCISVSNVW